MEPKEIDLVYRTMTAELAERALDESLLADLDPSGRFVPVTVKERVYWYFDQITDRKPKRVYIGPDNDPAIKQRVASFQRIKVDYKARRKLVSTLVRQAYLPRPEEFTGNIVQALAAAGLFRLRGVLIGTVAYQCYPVLLGVRLPNVAIQTGDADFAQFHSISAAVGDEIPPILDVLRRVDPGFRAVPHQVDSRHSTQFVCGSYKVEFLTPLTGSNDLAAGPSPMPALGGASAQPLRFLDFLIHEPVRSVMLHKAGVAVTLPAPERFAVHKLMISARRRDDVTGRAKATKDGQQVVMLAKALKLCRRSEDLVSAYTEAWERGPSWREALQQGLRRLDPRDAESIMQMLREELNGLGSDPNEYGLSDVF
jgi:hypothetical protein